MNNAVITFNRKLSTIAMIISTTTVIDDIDGTIMVKICLN
jgi:hypothetical protein